jgi:CBS domain-containing protein
LPDPVVTEIMRTDFPTLSPDDSIATICRQIVDSGLPGLPVMENGKIIGIITEGDIISREAEVDVPAPTTFFDAIFSIDAGQDFDEEIRKVASISARELMSHPVYNVLHTATLEQVATLMIDRRVNPVPVVDDNHVLVGIVSRTDLVGVIAKLESEAGPVDSDIDENQP